VRTCIDVSAASARYSVAGSIVRQPGVRCRSGTARIRPEVVVAVRQKAGALQALAEI